MSSAHTGRCARDCNTPPRWDENNIIVASLAFASFQHTSLRGRKQYFNTVSIDDEVSTHSLMGTETPSHRGYQSSCFVLTHPLTGTKSHLYRTSTPSDQLQHTPFRGRKRKQILRERKPSVSTYPTGGRKLLGYPASELALFGFNIPPCWDGNLHSIPFFVFVSIFQHTPSRGRKHCHYSNCQTSYVSTRPPAGTKTSTTVVRHNSLAQFQHTLLRGRKLNNLVVDLWPRLVSTLPLHGDENTHFRHHVDHQMFQHTLLRGRKLVDELLEILHRVSTHPLTGTTSKVTYH